MAGPPERGSGRRFDARRGYNRIGRLQDTQAFYERPALDALITALALERAAHVLEIGCGTGAFARRLLRDELPAGATYTGTEVSDRMAGLARSRLAPFGDRARVVLVGPDDPLPAEPAAPDRVIANYVVDLLDDADTARLLGEVAQRLAPSGRVGLVTITDGSRGVPRAVTGAWRAVWRRAPGLVGGCRPVDPVPAVRAAGLVVQSRVTVTAWGVPSEVVVATRPGSDVAP